MASLELPSKTMIGTLAHSGTYIGKWKIANEKHCMAIAYQLNANHITVAFDFGFVLLIILLASNKTDKIG